MHNQSRSNNAAILKLQDLLDSIDGLTDDEKEEYFQFIARAYTKEKVAELAKKEEAELKTFMKAEGYYGRESLLKLMVVFIAFGDYIDANPEFEVFFSEKKGYYFRVMVSEPEMGAFNGKYLSETALITDADSFFAYLVTRIINDVMDLELNGPHIDYDLAENEMVELHRRIDPIIDVFQNESHKHYIHLFEEVVKKWENNDPYDPCF